jgi:hypothetical protein
VSESATDTVPSCDVCGDRLTADTISYTLPELCTDCAEALGDDGWSDPSVGVTRMGEGWFAAYTVRTPEGTLVFDADADTIPEALRELADEIEGLEGSA